ncbi:cysteine proteinase [Daldinia loculata]|uniref:cysteine proteinase n=1 Tax=Daldinia loculata TaxID=103429 RepID=UPI0020C27099|nr:cysteine proteinase [Daldinia loculata]KAI1649481.1 cysteine proteinase [Daldinia loculata]KAI2783137.1 cysteine proteinase [Daldinia loculata]
MDSSQHSPLHDWRIPVHCIFCSHCRAIRASINREAHDQAHLNAQVHAREVGNSSRPAPLHRARVIKIPRSNLSVTIQLPNLQHPVAPDDKSTLPKSRKRIRPRWGEPSELEATAAEPVASQVEPARHTSQGLATEQQYPSTRTETLPFHSPRQIRPLSPETRRYLERPSSAVNARARFRVAAPKRVMPGAWPSELVEVDSAEVPVYHNMTLPTTPTPPPFATNVRNALTYLRDSSRSLYTTFNRIFRPRQSPSIPTPATSEDGRRTPKRRRLDREENGPFTPPELVDDRMDIDDDPVTTIPTGSSASELETSPSISPVISPNSAAAIASARRATRLFPYRKNLGLSSDSPSDQTNVITPPPSRREKKPVQQEEQVPERTWGPLPAPKYASIQEFFAHDDEICLPGLERLRLTPNDTKIYELDSQREDRLRIEKEKAEKERQEKLRIEEERLNEALRPLGLRRPKAPLITPLSDEWDQKAREAPNSGKAEQNKWRGARHRDGVELTPRDFAKLVPTGSWLNDNAIQSTLVHLATYVNDAAGIIPKQTTPKCVALSSQYWSNFLREPKNNVYARGLDRNWGMKPTNFLDINTVLIPVNKNNHWTVLVVRPSRRTVSYVDSFQTAGADHIHDVHTWMKYFLGDKYVADEWHTEYYSVPTQTNGYDCGMFVITNSIYLSLGIDPSGYSEGEMPLQRRRIAAMLLNGGFTGPFDLSHL